MIEVLNFFFLNKYIFSDTLLFYVIIDALLGNVPALIEKDVLAMGVVIIEISKLAYTVEGIDISAKAGFLTFSNLSFRHAHDPVFPLRVCLSWVSVTVVSLLETSEFNDSCMST